MKFPLAEIEIIITAYTKVAEIFDNFFDSMVNTLNIEGDRSALRITGNEIDPIHIALQKTVKVLCCLPSEKI